MIGSHRLALALVGSAALVSGSRLATAAQGDLHVPPGFTLERIATVPRARELAVTPNGDLIVGTSTATVYIVPNAQGAAGRSAPFVRLDDAPAAGVALAANRLYIGSQFGVWEVPYRVGARQPAGAPRKIATVRPSGVARDHVTTSVAIARGTLYASVGASCDACQPELDDTRATVQRVGPGGKLTPVAARIRNAIALAENPATGALWAGVAGQDELEHGDPYEIFDPVTDHPGVPDYGWPTCYEDHRSVDGENCAAETPERVAFPAYDTPIGAVFYPLHPTGAYAFPAPYRGGAFVTLHGSWHQPPVPPRVAFVAMDGDQPKTPVNWSDPDVQWREFVGGFQNADGTRNARPTGIAVGPDGSLFVSCDDTGAIYRIRPAR